MNTVSWEAIKDFYKTKFGIDGWVVEMYANLDILALCVSGASNQSIVDFLELSLEEVSAVIKDTFGFDGWEFELPINPYHIFMTFKGSRSSLEHFSSFVQEVTFEFQKYSIENISVEKLFYMCEAFSDIEERINDEWI